MKTLFTILICCFGFTILQAQGEHERIKSLKTAYFTEQLELTSAEAERFWPIYNAHYKKVDNLYKREDREIEDELKDPSQVSEAKAARLLKTYMSIEAAKLYEHEKLVEDLDGILSKKKILLVFKAEDDFRKRLLREYRERKRKNKERREKPQP